MDVLRVNTDGADMGETNAEKKKRKREEAEERQKTWAEIRPSEKLRLLKLRPGKAKKQAERIKKHM